MVKHLPVSRAPGFGRLLRILGPKKPTKGCTIFDTTVCPPTVLCPHSSLCRVVESYFHCRPTHRWPLAAAAPKLCCITSPPDGRKDRTMSRQLVPPGSWGPPVNLPYGTSLPRMRDSRQHNQEHAVSSCLVARSPIIATPRNKWRDGTRRCRECTRCCPFPLALHTRLQANNVVRPQFRAVLVPLPSPWTIWPVDVLAFVFARVSPRSLCHRARLPSP